MWSLIGQTPSLSIVRQIRLFDVWKDPSASGQAEKSLAFRFWLQDTDQTLEDSRVDACMTSIRDALVAQHQARQR
jgi:phenylalanyl-tRNA synthetase beta chain